jgi:hypothetical protein
MVRLFIGGLAADTTPALLAPRFTPFGDVLPAKLQCSSDGGPDPCRGFGYVSLAAKDEAALRRCLSAVRCRWQVVSNACMLVPLPSGQHVAT